MLTSFRYFVWFFCLFHTLGTQAQASEDVKIFHQLMKKAPTDNRTERLLYFAQQLLDKPYIAYTLEGPTEKLVINLHAFDCATFVESVTALTFCKDTSLASFQNQLLQLRYRFGHVNGYASRLHYFSDWLITNERKGFIQNITALCGGQPYSKDISFMSSHANKYPALEDYKNLEGIKMAESDLKRTKLTYIPKTKLEKQEYSIQSGDIIAITSGVAGLDIAHEGFAIRQQGRVYFLHASQDLGKVVITKEPLVDYLLKHPKQTGVMIARIKEGKYQ